MVINVYKEYKIGGMNSIIKYRTKRKKGDLKKKYDLKK